MDDKSRLVHHASVDRMVEWVDTDASGHQHNSAVMRWVESAEAELVRALDLPEYFPSTPRVHQAISYRSKLWFGQRITATVDVRKLGRTSMTYAFEVHGHPHARSEGGIAAFGTVTVAYVPPGSASAQPWPREILDALGPLQPDGDSRP